MNDGDEIRPIQSMDEGSLNIFFSELAMEPEVIRYFHPHPFDRSTAKAIADHPGTDIYLAYFSKGKIAGYAMLRGWDEGFAIPSFGVVVAPSHQGRGIGSRLLRECTRIAVEMGAEQMMLKVHPENRRALEWYRASGFQQFDHADDGQIVMRMTLAL